MNRPYVSQAFQVELFVSESRFLFLFQFPRTLSSDFANQTVGGLQRRADIVRKANKR
jgi:hypothetical protein